jgi:hypothetical protein
MSSNHTVRKRDSISGRSFYTQMNASVDNGVWHPPESKKQVELRSYFELQKNISRDSSTERLDKGLSATSTFFTERRREWILVPGWITFIAPPITEGCSW